MKEVKTFGFCDFVQFLEAEQADDAPAENRITPSEDLSYTDSEVRSPPDYRHISFGEELSCHLNELKQHRAATIFFTP